MAQIAKNIVPTDDLKKGRYAGQQFCCSGWAKMESETSYSPFEAQFSGPYWNKAAFTAYYAMEHEYYSYSEYTSGIEETRVGDPINLCPWCGSQKPGNQEFYS